MIGSCPLIDSGSGFSYGATGDFTPNVTVAYTGLDIFNDINLKWRSSGFSNFGNCVSYIAGTDSNWGVQFQADAGFKVTLTSFDLGKSGTSAVMSGILIQNAAGTTLWDSGNVTLNGAGVPGQSFVLPAGITDTRLTIVVRARVVSPDPAPAGTNGTALDNIVFSQTSTSAAPAIAMSSSFQWRPECHILPGNSPSVHGFGNLDGCHPHAIQSICDSPVPVFQANNTFERRGEVGRRRPTRVGRARELHLR